VVIGKTFLPSANLAIYRNDYVVYAIGVVTCILLSLDFFRSRIFFVLACYVVILFLNYFFESFINLGNILSESFTIIVTACFCFNLFGNNYDKRLANCLTLLFGVIIVVYSIMTYIFYISNPGIMRAAAMARNYETYHPYFLRGLAPYSFPHALTCIIPALVLGIKNKHINPMKRWLSVMLLILSLVLIYITQATGALIVAVVAIILSMIVKIGNAHKSVIPVVITSIFLLPLVISPEIQKWTIGLIERLIGDDNFYSHKIEELEASVYGVEYEGDIAYRGSLLGETIDAILTHPFLGVSDMSYGEHNALLDRWAEYGLIGLVPLLLGMVWLIKRCSRHLSKDVLIFYYIGIASSFLMMLTKSMFGWHQWFAFLIVLPVMIRFFSVETNNKLINVKN
jgi:O-antigen ligase